MLEWRRGEFKILAGEGAVDVTCVHGLLTEASWAEDIPLFLVETAIEHSLCFGVWKVSEQIGFGRWITDHATFAYMSDVVIRQDFRGLGLGKWLVECMMGHPDIRFVRTRLLATQDAHSLYRKFGFEALDHPERYMIKRWGRKYGDIEPEEKSDL